MISPSELIAHAVPRLLEERGLRPHAPVGDEILFEGVVAGDPFWVMVTPMPRDAAGARRTMESLGSRFKPAQPATRGLGMLVLLRTAGQEPDLAALEAIPPREGTEPILRAGLLDLADGSLTGNFGAIRPMAAVAKTIEKAARAALAGEKPPDLEAIVDREVNLARAYRAARPWATWAVVATVAGLVLVQRYLDPLKKLRLDRLLEGVWRWDLVLANTMIYPIAKEQEFASMGTIWLVLTVIGVLSLGALVERLYGRGAYLAMWFAPSLGAAYLGHRLQWGVGAGPISAMFGLTGCTLAMGFLRRALPWPFRRGLLVSSAPMMVIFGISIWFSGMASWSIVAAVVGGGVLAAVLPFRAPISTDGGPLPLRLAAWGIAIACLWGAGLATYREYLRPDEAPKASEHVSEEGWSITAPAGYRVEKAEGGVTIVRNARLSISIETMPADEDGPLDRVVGAERERLRARGASLRDEKLEIGGNPWWWVHMDLGDASDEWYIGDAGGLRVRVHASGSRGAIQKGQADVRAVVDSFRPTR